MKEWRIMAIASLLVNVLLVALIWVTVVKAQEVVEDKNQIVRNLEDEVAQLKGHTEVSIAHLEEVTLETEQVDEVKTVEAATKESTFEEVQVVEEEVVTEQPAQVTEPIQQTSYKDKLLSYKSSLQADYEYVYFLYDGMPSEDILYQEMSNAEVTAMYEDIYEKTDVVLNKVYGILKDTLPTSEFSQLQTEQRAWLQRVTESKEQRLAMGGSSAATDAMFDLGMETQQRCLELMMQYFEFEDYYGN